MAVWAMRSLGGSLPDLAVSGHRHDLDIGCTFAGLDTATLHTVPGYFRLGFAVRMGYSDHGSLAVAAVAAATAHTARFGNLTYC